MPLLKEIKLESGLLVLWEITEGLNELISLCKGLNIEADFQKIKNIRRKKEWLAVRLLLKEIGCTNVSISYNGNNQPKINHPKYKKISISHSNKLAGIIVHENSSVGLDIETINRDYKKVEHKYLSPKEQDFAKNVENGLALFWCVKEAIYKAAGIPGVHFSDQIRIEEIKRNKLFAELHSNEIIKEYTLNYFQLDEQLITYLIDD